MRGLLAAKGGLSRGRKAIGSAHEQGSEDRRASSQQSMKVLLGAARWYVGGGELRSDWGGGKVRLVGRGLRRLR